MDMTNTKQGSVYIWAVKALFLVVSYNVAQLNAKALPNCSYPAVYSFGDSLTDVGNSIAAFPDQFARSELDPFGVEFPMHAADRWSDGKLLVDFLEFGVRGRPNYPWLRSIAGDFEYGTNFASAGGSSRNSTGWKPYHGFNTPFSLNVQVEWYERYTVRLLTYYYYKNTFGDSAVVETTLPAESSLNQSLYVMHAGFHDYFFDLYEKKLTPGQGLDIVPDVVDAINSAIESLVGLYATEILVVNLPPLGCLPALLTLFSSNYSDEYDTYGCLKKINLISTTHNKILQDTVTDLRAKFTNVTFYLGNLHNVYIDILKSPASYNVTKPLQAACGYGGKYNFNMEVKCGEIGKVGDKLVNLTSISHTTAKKYLSFDGIHLSNTANKAIAKAFFYGKHITPAGGFNCTPDYSRFDDRQ